MAKTITGDRELDAVLAQLASGARPMVRRALGKAGIVLKKEIKGRIPGRYKNARAAVGHRVVAEQGKLSLKTGFAVGKSTANPKRRSSKGGVGISRSNIHWLVLGTEKRTRKSDGQSTGIMPPILAGIIPAAHAASQGRLMSELEKSIQHSLEKIRAKGRKGKRR